MSAALIWFRQDLRVSDNPALAMACNNHQKVIPLYILDEKTMTTGGAQHWWLHHSLFSLQNELQKMGLDLFLKKGDALSVLSEIIQNYSIDRIYWNRCYEPAAIQRDIRIKLTLQKEGIHVQSSNGSLLNEPWTVKNKSGNYFKVFTPYWRQCLKQISIPPQAGILHNPICLNISGEALSSWKLLPVKPDWSGEFHTRWQPGEEGAQHKLDDFIHHHLSGYRHQRDIPAEDATSHLSPHLHFGEISPWQILRSLEQIRDDKNVDLASMERFMSELGWREFSYYLLYHFPKLPDLSFRSAFEAFIWQKDTAMLRAWQQGLTGYPIVDAGMRELWRTGYMHNRVRMITASFLTKHLRQDWRTGASWFLDTLVDADLANNSSGWQWVAGSGADAAPYFRIFNPVLQGEKFDPHGAYVRRWVPELSAVTDKWIHKPWAAPAGDLKIVLGRDYPWPVVDHAEARRQALLEYKKLKPAV